MAGRHPFQRYPTPQNDNDDSDEEVSYPDFIALNTQSRLPNFQNASPTNPPPGMEFVRGLPGGRGRGGGLGRGFERNKQCGFGFYEGGVGYFRAIGGEQEEPQQPEFQRQEQKPKMPPVPTQYEQCHDQQQIRRPFVSPMATRLMPYHHPMDFMPQEHETSRLVHRRIVTEKETTITRKIEKNGETSSSSSTVTKKIGSGTDAGKKVEANSSSAKKDEKKDKGKGKDGRCKK